jgi:hypothetical protein
MYQSQKKYIKIMSNKDVKCLVRGNNIYTNGKIYFARIINPDYVVTMADNLECYRIAGNGDSLYWKNDAEFFKNFVLLEEDFDLYGLINENVNFFYNEDKSKCEKLIIKSFKDDCFYAKSTFDSTEFLLKVKDFNNDLSEKAWTTS